MVATLGHETGTFAPGLQDRRLATQVSHHLLLSHGLALQALLADGCRSAPGIVLNLAPVYPATPSAEDEAAARLEDGKLRRWYTDALFKARYPQDMLEHLGGDAPRVEPGDLAAIAQPMDFLGVNYYSRMVVSAAEPWNVAHSGRLLTDMGWEVYPEGLTDLLVGLQRDDAVPPLFVTENGAAFIDRVDGDRVADYIARHIEAVGAARRAGVEVKGYMVWSLLDNFEWASGHAKRFGIVHVDCATQRRTPKDSALWYREFLQRQRAARPARHTAPGRA